MNNQDIRWEQRFSNYVKALDRLEEFIAYIEQNFLSETSSRKALSPDSVLHDIVKQGLIQSFEYTHELAWNVMKDFLQSRGNEPIYGSIDATRLAFSTGLIDDGDVWMEMIKSRNQTSHTYNDEIASEIFAKIMEAYYPAFDRLRARMEEERSGRQGEIF